MKTLWEGHYLDGQSAVPQRAEIQVGADGLSLRLEGGRGFVWPYAEIRQTQGSYPGEPVRLERGGEIPEVLIVDDTDFLLSLRAQSSRHPFQFHNPGFRRARLWLTLGAAGTTVIVALLLYRWGIPLMANIVTPHVPVSWEKGLGESELEILAPPNSRLHNRALDSAIRRIVERLAATQKKCPYRFRVTVSNLPIVNAFALPGGSIVVFRGLLKETRTAEELAGVLAHEMQHVLKRHTTKKIIQDSSTGLLLSAMAGDATGSMAFALQSARSLALLEYGREEEAEADREGMRMILAAHLNPAGMIGFFETLQGREKFPTYLKYVSSHPATQDRIKTLKEMVRRESRSAKIEKLLPGVVWGDLLRNLGPLPKF